ncbi:unnamed protein product [Mycena citricolor]|uniref:Homeobox domain-containing protein n=1 Tax=Mycena citricolor TaxID=2018698 RepID=A0AAD2GZ42_9AGAR|nr:unnamed protein product [Mycena citricolor]CAK5281624.1 unnamed protein product [Mycena citricolor]
MSTRDDRYYNSHRARSPSADQSGGFFQTGQGGRTLLPPISSASPISHIPVPPHSSQFQSRRFEYNQPCNNQWQPNNAPMPAPQPSYFYEDTRFASSQPAYSAAMYVPRSASVAPGQTSDMRKLPPLSTTPGPARDDRWNSSYAPHGFNGAQQNTGIRSPTASYPVPYNSAYQQPPNYSYQPLGTHMMPDALRSSSPYGRAPPTPPPVSPTSADEPTVKKKRKRADAAQLRVLNDTYARTAFPSTDERLALAKALDMSPRSVQIWFQNKRQSMRQTNRQSNSAHQSFSLSSDEQGIDDGEYEPRGSAQQVSSSHRRGRSQEEAIDSRKWGPRGY